MKNSVSISSLTKPIAAFLKRYHIVLFVLIVAGSLAVALFTLMQSVQPSSDQPPVTTSSLRFDQSTIDAIDQLGTRDDTRGKLNLPSGRVNPLSE